MESVFTDLNAYRSTVENAVYGKGIIYRSEPDSLNQV